MAKGASTDGVPAFLPAVPGLFHLAVLRRAVWSLDAQVSRVPRGPASPSLDRRSLGARHRDDAG